MKKAFSFLILLVFWCPARAQDRNIDSLKQLLKSDINDTTRMQVLKGLVEITGHGEWQQYNASLQKLAEQKLGSKKLSPALKKKANDFLAWSYHNTGISFLEQTESDSALQWFSKALTVALQNNNAEIMGAAQHQIGNIYYRKGQYKKASVYIYKALKIFEASGEQQGIADALMSIGDLHHQQHGQNKQALEYYQRSLQIQEKIDDWMGMGASFSRIAVVYQEQEDFIRASQYFKKALHLIEMTQDPRQAANVMNNLGRLMHKLNKSDSALFYYRQGLEQWEILQDKAGIAQSWYYMGNVYYGQKKYDAALRALDKALTMASEIHYANIMATSYRLLYLCLKSKGRYADALDAHEKYNTLIDSLQNKSTENALMEQKLQYTFEKKELLSKAQSEKRINALKIDAERRTVRKNTWIVVLISLSVLLSISAYFLYKYYKQRSIIAAQKTHLLQQKLLVSQMNPHFIFNSLNAIQNYIFKQDSLQAGTYLARFADLMRMILEFSRKEFITLEQEITLLQHYFDLQQLRFENRFDYSIETGEDIEPENLLIPPMLAQPFIENAIEHGIFYKEGKGNIKVKIQFEDERLVYQIEDNGIGIEKAMQLKKNVEKKHESLAMIITRERMDGFNLGSYRKTTLEITDLGKNNTGISGVKVKFSVPYKEK